MRKGIRIGILTYHRAENYGAMLQAYALRCFLINQNFDTTIIDYWPQYHKNNFKLFNLNSLRRYTFLGRFKYFFIFFTSLFWKILRKKNFNNFAISNFNLQNKPMFNSINEKCEMFDIVIYGSDQIWRKQSFPEFNGFDKWYFGSNNITASKKIAYAASMGIINVNDQDRLFLKESLKNFSNISVRENNLLELINDMGFQSELVLDPVFFLSRSDWEKLISNNFKPPAERYILFYNLLNTKEGVEFVDLLEKETGFKVIEICKRTDLKSTGKRFLKSASVQSFLGLISNAEIVVSNSFHGVALSVIFEKQFYAVGMGSKSERVLSLLSLLNITERYYNQANNISFEERINYNDVFGRLKELQEKSASFLIDSITKQ